MSGAVRTTRGALAWLCGVLVATASIARAPEPLPPYTEAYAPQSVDERGLWMEADEDERVLRDSPALIRDAALTAYVRGVLCRAVGEARCRGVRVYVLRVAAFNATMMPNGAMRVWSGLLLRMRNEAELATVLGHEFGHFELRHGLHDLRRTRTMDDMLAWMSILAPHDRQLAVTLVGLHFAHSRAEESEADRMGLRYLRAAGYRADAAPAVWDRQMAERDAALAARKRRAVRSLYAGFTDTHPTDLRRAADLRAAIGPDGAQGDDGAAAYRAALAPWRAQFLADQIKLNDFGASEFLLAQLADGHWGPELLLARGDLYRERGLPRDLVSAAGFYRAAIDAGSADPAAWRGLGLSLLRAQQSEAGRAALSTYLERVPEASDRAAIRALIDQTEAM